MFEQCNAGENSSQNYDVHSGKAMSQLGWFNFCLCCVLDNYFEMCFLESANACKVFAKNT